MMTSKEEAYKIIFTEADMIYNGDRPIKHTIRWLNEAIELLEEVRRSEPK